MDQIFWSSNSSVPKHRLIRKEGADPLRTIRWNCVALEFGGISLVNAWKKQNGKYTAQSLFCNLLCSYFYSSSCGAIFVTVFCRLISFSRFTIFHVHHLEERIKWSKKLASLAYQSSATEGTLSNVLHMIFILFIYFIFGALPAALMIFVVRDVFWRMFAKRSAVFPVWFWEPITCYWTHMLGPDVCAYVSFFSFKINASFFFSYGCSVNSTCVALWLNRFCNCDGLCI